MCINILKLLFNGDCNDNGVRTDKLPWISIFLWTISYNKCCCWAPHCQVVRGQSADDIKLISELIPHRVEQKSSSREGIILFPHFVNNLNNYTLLLITVKLLKVEGHKMAKNNSGKNFFHYFDKRQMHIFFNLLLSAWFCV